MTGRRDLLAALATAASAGLAGCGGESDDGTTGDSATPSTDGSSATDDATPAPEDLDPVELAPFWTTGEQYGVGTVADHHADDASDVWFTLTEGALTQLRYPRIDLLNYRSLSFLVADGEGYSARTKNESRRDDPLPGESNRRGGASDPVERRVVPTGDPGTLTFCHEFTPRDSDDDDDTDDTDTHDWELTAEYVADPESDAVLVDVTFEASDEYDLYVLGRPAVSGAVGDAGAVLGSDTATPALTASADPDGGAVLSPAGDPYPVSTALAADPGFDWATCESADADAAKLLVRGGIRPEATTEASGNLVLAGQLGAAVSEASTTLALGFADGDPEAARSVAEGALSRGYESAEQGYVASWDAFQERVSVPDSVRETGGGTSESAADLLATYRTAAATLKAVEDKTFTGAGIASPSVPWGDGVLAREPRDYGYNFVWSRDLYQSFSALDAMGTVEEARDATEYLFTTQQDDTGFLPQNTYLDGRTRWGGEQLDNVAFPLVMAGQLAVRHDLAFADLAYDYAHVRQSADYLVRNGPSTEQERWEEEGGYSPSTIAAEIAGLVSAGALALSVGAETDALLYLGVADHWRQQVPEWTATETGSLADEPYYVRIVGDGVPDDDSTRALANGGPTLDEREIADAGFLELVRLGIYPADDDLIRTSVEVVDDTIRVETPNGPGWYRYVGDGYGEGESGAPFPVATETRGRLWPIFSGERAEYELARGSEDETSEEGTREEETSEEETREGETGEEETSEEETSERDLAPASLLRSLADFGNAGRMLPEQVWDRDDPTDYGWERGEGTGSATPLSWSMAQFVRLAHGIDAGDPVETPRAVADRYAGGPPSRPALSVSFPDATVGEDAIEVAGETDADRVVVRAGGETWEPAIRDGAFSVGLSLSRGRTTLTVAAGSLAAADDGGESGADGDGGGSDGGGETPDWLRRATTTPTAVARSDVVYSPDE
ncbi:glycoside hydrolase family 15 protein [Salinirubrum litoreum]|uniref:Glycoside hydrolase family 15 protein n=1 Tax=Salinirubrum litoreum TaxID=1126234 RepID=A0ABD5R641_9EURY|nr:glycoside hydrolase family 15 protein [Salinirubrum litoreum]